MKKKILTVVGTRPNFIKITQFEKAFAQYSDVFEYKLLHTGQHFDENMSKIFFDQLNISAPDFYLDINRAESIDQLFSQLIMKLSDTFRSFKPDLVIVVGDVNSTFAAAFAANLCKIKVAHIESGLRSRDREMPEEINRLLTDVLADILFVTEESGISNIGKEGKAYKEVFFVGNTMIDTLVAFQDEISASEVLKHIKMKHENFVLMTMHRPSNVDNIKSLSSIIKIINELTKRYDVIFPIHPRTKNNFEKFQLLGELENIDNLNLLPPIGYLDFQHLIKEASYIITDSGGIQEEASFRKVPCLTLRENTERPITTKIGSNMLVELSSKAVLEGIRHMEQKETFEAFEIPPLWDGQSSRRIAKHLYQLNKEGRL